MEILSMETFESSFEKENKYSFLNELATSSMHGRAMLSDVTKLYIPKKTFKSAHPPTLKLLTKDFNVK